MRVICFLILFSFSLNMAGQDVIEWRGDRTGVYKETGLLKSWGKDGPTLLWHFDGLGLGHSSVSASSGKLYLTGMTDDVGYLYVFDKQGKLLNKKEYGPEWYVSHSGTRGTVVPNDGRLYLVSGRGELFCFDESSLQVLWKKSMEKDFGGEVPKYGVNESPLIVGDKLIFTAGGKDKNIVALNKKTGDLIWSSKAMGDISSYCSPIYVSDQAVPQVVTITGHHVVGIDIANGNLLWSFPYTNHFFEHPNTPVYDDGMILCTSSYGVGSVMLRLTNGGKGIEEVWSSKKLDCQTGHLLKLGNYAYGSGDSRSGGWHCVDWKTGESQYEDKSFAAGAIIAADGMLYCYSGKGELALVRATPEKFDIVSQFPITLGTEAHWAHPVVHQGILYVRHGDTLMAYDISGKK